MDKIVYKKEEKRQFFICTECAWMSSPWIKNWMNLKIISYTYFAHCELGTLTKRCFMLILILLGNTADCKHLHIAWRDVTLQRKTPEKIGTYYTSQFQENHNSNITNSLTCSPHHL